MVEIRHDETSSDESDSEDNSHVDANTEKANTSDAVATLAIPGIVETTPTGNSMTRVVSTKTTIVSTTTTVTDAPTTVDDESRRLAQLAQAIRGVHLTHDMPPLDQQDLPPMHVLEDDGSITVNKKVLKGDEIRRGVAASDAITTDNEESGYHSGVYSEVQERLTLLNKAPLPSRGFVMDVGFNKIAPVKPTSASILDMAAPDNLFRTGDTFGIEIRLATVPEPGFEQVPFPREFLGIRFPHEMVKRVSGTPASILNEMTYILKTSIELGQSKVSDLSSVQDTTREVHSHSQQGDGIQLNGACQACSKILHEYKKISPSRLSQVDPKSYPILQFSIPASQIQPTQAEDANHNVGVLELHDGRLEVKARVNCSSLHHLIQREKIRRTTEARLQQQQQQQQQQGESSSAPLAEGKLPMELKDLEDPGFVFTFELVHPTLNTVVAKYVTGPILFQTYSRGRS
ncbi:hypothetical protein BGZ98_003050 [Dissophora globulifera]|nr:hypothetical protein BGZ98_003050 [Dissophora globulifera]